MNQQIIDLHTHILPELDDGARSLRHSLEMARIAVESGVRVLVATPHCAGDRRAEVRSAADLLRRALQEEQIPLRLFLGMEIFGTPETAGLLRDGKLFTLNNSRYPLIEFDFGSDGTMESRVLADVIRAGFTPIVAHPERYACVRRDPELVNYWHRMGCLFQVNRGSLLGRFGEDARSMARELVCRGFATAVASDAHSPQMRTPWLMDAWDYLETDVSPAAARYLLWENPRRILKNQQPLLLEPELF